MPETPSKAVGNTQPAQTFTLAASGDCLLAQPVARNKFSRDYTVLNRLGSGSFGNVYACQAHAFEHRVVAVKQSKSAWCSESDRALRLDEVRKVLML